MAFLELEVDKCGLRSAKRENHVDKCGVGYPSSESILHESVAIDLESVSAVAVNPFYHNHDGCILQGFFAMFQ
jgi:hypothetical protein